jgi:D-serine/D-alanine/glycine transporter
VTSWAPGRALTTQPDTLAALLVTPSWFAVLGLASAVVRRSPVHQARVAEWTAMSDAETRDAAARA